MIYTHNEKVLCVRASKVILVIFQRLNIKFHRKKALQVNKKLKKLFCFDKFVQLIND
jgi:hypothetical protein